VWAAGNGAQPYNTTCDTPLGWSCIDNSNYDGQANNRGVIAVGAVDDQGKQAVYSESGANLWVASPGGEWCTNNSTGNSHAITTTDLTGNAGDNTATTAGTSDYTNQNYTKCMNGTSAATPGVAGVVALVLAANPNLGWRDVRIILAQSARQNDPNDVAGWQTNGAVYHFNHKYGFGVVNAEAAVTAAKSYGTNVATEKTYIAASPSNLGLVITDLTNAASPPAATTSTITVPDASTTGIGSIEWVEITVTATAPSPQADPNIFYSGDYDITLTSPDTTVSHLAEAHYCAGTNGACTLQYSGWVFGSAAHLGEAPVGAWTLTVKDGSLRGGNGTLDSWQLKFYGH
jgi:kexin